MQIAAQEIVDLGLKDAGYEYVNIDDCWSLDGRDNKTNRIRHDPDKFPDGISGTASKVHALGLKLGIYSDAGTETCAGYPASLGYEDIDAKTFSEWGVDCKRPTHPYPACAREIRKLLANKGTDLKYDNCNVPANWTDKYQYWPEYWYGTTEDQVGGTPAPGGYDWSKSNTTTRYNRMRDALVRQSRTIFYSLCNWGHSHVEQWGSETGQSWRMWGDIVPVWSGKDDYSWGFSKSLDPLPLGNICCPY